MRGLNSVAFEEYFAQPLRNGLTKPKRVRGEGTKMVNMGELFANDRIYSIEMDRVPMTEREAEVALLEEGDLLFARQSLVRQGAGQCSIFFGDSEPTTFESHLIRARLDRAKAAPLFLYYFFRSPEGRLMMDTIIEQVAAAGIRGSDLAKLPVPALELVEQKRIAHVLGTLDDKIELNRRMNQTLEAIARAIFKSWFIDFDPVIDNAILHGKPIPKEFAERAAVRREILGRSQPSPPPPLPEVEGKNYRGGFEFSGLVEKAREVRRKETPTEEILWEILRDRQFLDLGFRRQHQIGDYIADFYCHEQRLVLELDGGIHQPQQARDAKRDAYMQSLGLTVLRIPNTDVLENPDGVLSRIMRLVQSSPSPSGRGEGEGAGGLSPSTFGRGARGEGVASYRDLFPDSFQDSPLGKIPEGWSVGEVGDFGEVRYGPAYASKLFNDTGAGLPLLRIRDLKTHLPGVYTTEDHPRGEVVSPGDVVVGMDGEFRAHIWTGPASWMNQRVCKLSPRAPDVRGFVYFAAMGPLADCERAKTGTTVIHLSKRDVDSFRLIQPPGSVLQAYARLSEPLLDLGVRLVGSCSILAQMRDSLLPKLLSGDLAANRTGKA